MRPILVCRADGSASIGGGHLLRVNALAEAWRARDLSVMLVTRKASDEFRHLVASGFRVPDSEIYWLEQDSEEADLSAMRVLANRLQQKHSPLWLVADGYHYTPQYLSAVAELGFRVVLIDDEASPPRMAELGALGGISVIVNPNVYAKRSDYASVSSQTLLLLGLDYALLREQFLKSRTGSSRETTRADGCGSKLKLLVVGGAKMPSAFLKLVDEALVSTADLFEEITIIGRVPEANTLQGQARFSFVSPTPQVSEIYLDSDLAISAAGVTLSELAFLGVPAVAIAIAENQRRVASGFAALGAVVDLGCAADLSATTLRDTILALVGDRARLARMSERALSAVDGKGAQRVVDAMLLFGWQLRRAKDGDAEQIWQIANDPASLAASFRRGNMILWDEHREWFAKRLASPDSVIYVLSAESSAPGVAGVIRYECERQYATVSIELAPSLRGLRLASELLVESAKKFWLERGRMDLRALIKPDNLASKRAFLQAGYTFTAATVVAEQQAELYTLSSGN